MKRFGEFDYGDAGNGPCGYMVCADGHHFLFSDGSRFGESTELSYKGACNGSCELRDPSVTAAVQTALTNLTGGRWILSKGADKD